jgi:FtsP/CotA-like multicopper oxidase with cupredoxin domain
MSFTRRQMLAGLAGLGVVGLGVGGARYWLARPENVATHDYELIAAPLDLELVPGHITPAWAYGGQAPGVELRCRQGERLRVRFINKLEVPTTIHWHGIRLPLAMDGVPYVSQAPVLPGEYFDYDFICPDAGSFWYHPHVASGEQLGRGLVGALIVDEREPSGFLHEHTLNLKSWHVDEQGALINLDNTLTYRLNLPGADARIYALDGNPVEPRPLGKEYWLGPGMRIELGLQVPVAGTELSLRNGPLRLATLRATASAEPAGEWPAALPANPVAEPDLAAAQTLTFNFEWAGAVSVGLEQGAAHSFWQINGQAWDINDKTCADRPIARLELGKSYIVELRNLSQYQHPIHLHGMTFKVLASDRKIIIPYFTDTYLLGKNERARVALVADNPGLWMFHCHVIDHMETGLMASVEVV